MLTRSSVDRVTGAGRLTVADADRARNVAIRALDAPNDRGDRETADYWVGYLSNAL
jgi:hypothetical protein